MKKTLVTFTSSGVIIAAVLALAPMVFAQSNTSGSLNGTTDTIEVNPGDGPTWSDNGCGENGKLCPNVIPGNDDNTGTQNGNLSASPTSGAAGLTVLFTASSLSAGTYIIDYGDGANSGPQSGKNCSGPQRIENGQITNLDNLLCLTAKHTYQTSGTYTALLYPYAACVWNEPFCEIDVQALGSVEIVVGVNYGNDGTVDNGTNPGGEQVNVVLVNADGTVNEDNQGFFDWVAGWNVWNIFGNGNDDGCGENGKLCPNQIGDDNGGNSNGGNLDDCGTNGKLCPNQIGDGNDGNDGNINGNNNDGNINDDGTNDDGGPTNTTNIDASSGVNAGGEAPSSFSFSALLRNLVAFFGF